MSAISDFLLWVEEEYPEEVLNPAHYMDTDYDTWLFVEYLESKETDNV